ncbi:CapK protein [Methanosarcina mazei Tuc01]|uniref:CapK protein n=1 Tax=Methanosarcina mazei Tuc01 TaxID=1236903 RepID=M1QMY8_METMZ|nr:CapK protein [Methanosarcina mazei Tuc01]
MSKGYFKIIELMQKKVLRNALLNVPYYRDCVPISANEVEPE